MFWIPPFWPNSIRTTQTGPHSEAVAGPVAVVGRQEPPLEEGVLSRNHSHHQQHSPDHTHLITEHRHLSPLIKSTISTHSSQAVTVWSQTLYVLLTWLTYLCLPPSCSHVPISVLHRSPPFLCSTISSLYCSHCIPWKRKKDLLRSDKTLLNIAIPCALTWTLHLASLHCHLSTNLLLFALTSVSLVYLLTLTLWKLIRSQLSHTNNFPTPLSPNNFA